MRTMITARNVFSRWNLVYLVISYLSSPVVDSLAPWLAILFNYCFEIRKDCAEFPEAVQKI
jgi:hypothetical protein